MSTTQHTPGPWFVVESGHRIRIHGPYQPPNGNPVCASGTCLHKLQIWESKTGASRGSSPTWQGFTERERADAHLIASAPELLAAATSVRDCLKQLKDLANCNDAVRKSLTHCGNHLNAAIARAEGRTP